MRSRWLVVIAVASLCLNLAVVGTYFLRRAHREFPRRPPLRGLAPEALERLRAVRESLMPEFAAIAGQEQRDDSLLWSEMSSDNPDSLRVDSLASEMGRLHGRMRAMLFWQMRRELTMLPAKARAEYLRRLMTMRPGFGPGRGMGRHMRRGFRMPPPGVEPPPGPPPESGD